MIGWEQTEQISLKSEKNRAIDSLCDIMRITFADANVR